MSGPENQFIKSVHTHLPADLYRMKNHNQFNSGIADVWYSGTRGDVWIEYKFITIPARANTVIDLISGKTPSISYLQQDWLRGRHAEGRKVGVMVGSKKGGVWFPGLEWDMTYTSAGFQSLLLERKYLANTILNIVR